MKLNSHKIDGKLPGQDALEGHKQAHCASQLDNQERSRGKNFFNLHSEQIELIILSFNNFFGALSRPTVCCVTIFSPAFESEKIKVWERWKGLQVGEEN
jgi:hypothetical protein